MSLELKFLAALLLLVLKLGCISSSHFMVDMGIGFSQELAMKQIKTLKFCMFYFPQCQHVNDFEMYHIIYFRGKKHYSLTCTYGLEDEYRVQLILKCKKMYILSSVKYHHIHYHKDISAFTRTGTVASKSALSNPDIMLATNVI